MSILNTAVGSPVEKRRRRRLPLAILILAAGFAAALLTYLQSSTAAEDFDPLDQNIPLAFGPANFAEALTEGDSRVALNLERVARDPEAWSYRERLSLALLARAQLSAEFEDFLAASKAIAQAASLAPEGAGPGLSIAVVNLSLHRNKNAAHGVDLAAAAVVAPITEDRAEIEAIRGDLAFYQGNYGDARKHYEGANALHSEAVTLFRLASWHKYRGDFDQAIALYKDGAKIVKSRTPQRFSAYLLQIGALELQQGNWDTARRYFERADSIFPGYWLAEAHIAQMDAVAGNMAAAEKRYLDIINRTKNPDVMEALVALYDYQGRDSEAQLWSKRAQVIWTTRVSLLPETYYDHAFDHALGVGDTASALALAQKNYAGRPYGDAAIGLARARIANDQPEQALELLEKQEKAGWRSVELFTAMAAAYQATGSVEQAQRVKKAALAINPKTFDAVAELLAFGNH